MHTDELPTDIGMARRLIREQFPAWTDLPLTAVESTGTVHAIYRLGGEMQIRLPRLVEWVPDLAKDSLWLPRLRPLVPLQIPNPIAEGRRTPDYPATWAVYDWIEGDMALPDTIEDQTATARDLAGFITALQAIDTTNAPSNTHRGGPLATADASTRAAIDRLSGDIDVASLLDVWETALAAPGWNRPQVWTHGDLWHSNLLLRKGRIAAVIDFGSFGVGDPAIDMIVAWSLLTTESRAVFRSELGVDDATWIRGMGWAISMAALALPYYRDTNPVIVANSRRMIGEILG